MRRIGARRAGGAVALIGPRVRALPPALPALRGWVAAGLAREAEQRRLFPWLAVAFGGGILVYFAAADGAPSLAAPLIAAALALAPVPVLGARPAALAAALAVAAALLGFAAATWRVSQVAAPILTRTTIGPLVGTVEALDEREVGARLVIRVESFAGLAPEARPARVRVSFRKTPIPRPGDVVAATARLLPPRRRPGPAATTSPGTPTSRGSARWARWSARSPSGRRPSRRRWACGSPRRWTRPATGSRAGSRRPPAARRARWRRPW